MESNYQGKAEYIKQIYKKNSKWNPPPAPPLIEEKITAFEKLLRTEHKKLNHKYSMRSLSSLTSTQLTTLRSLQQNKHIIIKPTDKNLGPALMDLDRYIKQVLQEHLLTDDYIQLTETEMSRKMSLLKPPLSDFQSSMASPRYIKPL
jgi:hypothetical protein